MSLYLFLNTCFVLCRYWEHHNKYSRAANTGEHSRSRRAARDDSNRNTCSLYIQTDPLLWRHVREGFSDVSISIKILLSLLSAERKILKKILEHRFSGIIMEIPKRGWQLENPHLYRFGRARSPSYTLSTKLKRVDFLAGPFIIFNVKRACLSRPLDEYQLVNNWRELPQDRNKRHNLVSEAKIIE